MIPRELIFRVFVSSTFSDLIAERNALQEHVFPRLREFCQKRGARFQAIDLRWGVSEEAALDQQTMNICLEVGDFPGPAGIVQFGLLPLCVNWSASPGGVSITLEIRPLS